MRERGRGREGREGCREGGRRRQREGEVGEKKKICRGRDRKKIFFTSFPRFQSVLHTKTSKKRQMLSFAVFPAERRQNTYGSSFLPG